MSVAKGDKDRTSCMCNNVHCTLITDSLAVFSAEGVGGGVMDVAASETGTTEDREVDGMQGGERGSKIRRLSSLPYNSTLDQLRIVCQ